MGIFSLTVSCQNAFSDEEPFDFVVNLAAETKMGQSDPVSIPSLIFIQFILIILK